MKSFVVYLLCVNFLLVSFNMSAQDKPNDALPYEELKGVPEEYTAANVAARFVDGLGFRYFWATEGLTEKEMETRATEESRTIFETIVHIYQLN